MTPLADWIKAARLPESNPAIGTRDVTPLPAHVGLWLDRCLIQRQEQEHERATEDHAARRKLHDVAMKALRLSGSTPPPAIASYRMRYERHRAEADEVDAGTSRRVIEATARSRVLLHPATSSTVTDGSLLLHHTYGVPYLPGSALKGICRHRAERLQADGVLLSGVKDWPSLLFGWTGEGETGGESGLFDFWDALWVPEPPSGGGSDFTPLVEDIVNPHHSDYYTRKEDRPPPSDGDAPIPTHILTVAPQTRFLIVVECRAQGGRTKDLLDWMVTTLLRDALRGDGIGARTRAGYGRLDLDLPAAAGDIAGQGGGRPTSLFGATKQHRQVAPVSRNKSNRSLRADLDGGGNAEAHGPAADALFAALPESVQQDLKKVRAVRLLVTWEEQGNFRRIVGLEADPASRVSADAPLTKR